MVQPKIDPMNSSGGAAAARDVFSEAKRASRQESAHAGEVLSGFGSSGKSRATSSKAVSSMSEIALFFKWLGDKSAKMPALTRMFVIGAILYAILPIDLIPDFLPGFGVIDDAVVLGLLIGNIRSMLMAYRELITPSEDPRVPDPPQEM